VVLVYLFIFKLMLKSLKKYEIISINYQYFTCHRYDIEVPVQYDSSNIDIGDVL